jgi:hypothetical protein
MTGLDFYSKHKCTEAPQTVPFCSLLIPIDDAKPTFLEFGLLFLRPKDLIRREDEGRNGQKTAPGNRRQKWARPRIRLLLNGLDYGNPQGTPAVPKSTFGPG